MEGNRDKEQGETPGDTIHKGKPLGLSLLMPFTSYHRWTKPAHHHVGQKVCVYQVIIPE